MQFELLKTDTGINPKISAGCKFDQPTVNLGDLLDLSVLVILKTGKWGCIECTKEAGNPLETWTCHPPKSERKAIMPACPTSISRLISIIRPRSFSGFNSWVMARDISRR